MDVKSACFSYSVDLLACLAVDVCWEHMCVMVSVCVFVNATMDFRLLWCNGHMSFRPVNNV